MQSKLFICSQPALKYPLPHKPGEREEEGGEKREEEGGGGGRREGGAERKGEKAKRNDEVKSNVVRSIVTSFPGYFIYKEKLGQS